MEKKSKLLLDLSTIQERATEALEAVRTNQPAAKIFRILGDIRQHSAELPHADTASDTLKEILGK